MLLLPWCYSGGLKCGSKLKIENLVIVIELNVIANLNEKLRTVCNYFEKTLSDL